MAATQPVHIALRQIRWCECRVTKDTRVTPVQVSLLRSLNYADTRVTAKFGGEFYTLARANRPKHEADVNARRG
jgi:hypothetical protein